MKTSMLAAMIGCFALASPAFPAGSDRLSVLHSFSGPDGANPFAALIQARDGNFYGTTLQGGDANRGTVFQMTPDGTVSVLHSFSGPDGASPYAALLQASDGSFYGTASSNGVADNRGTVFQMTSDGAFTVLHTFRGPDGADPGGALIQANDGNFYGTTVQGGAEAVGGYGTVFQMTPDGALTVLHGFTIGSDDGEGPWAPLLQASDGNFYGTAAVSEVISSRRGTVFQITRDGAFSVVHTFSGPDGS